MKFVDSLPIRKIPYIGGMIETTLTKMGILTGKDLRDRAADLCLIYKTKPAILSFLLNCGMALGLLKHDRENSYGIGNRGVSISETFRARKEYKEFKSKIA